VGEVRRALITDVVWPSIDVEAEVLAAAGIEAVLAPAGDEATLVAAAAAGCAAILTCFARVTGPVIAAASGLRVVARYGVGLDNIDVAAAERQGAVVVNVPDYCVDEVATHAVAMALSLWRRLPSYDRATRAGRWGVQPDLPLRRLAGRRFGVVGRGRIGAAVAARAAAFGLEVVDGWRGCDLVSLHVPLTAATRHLIGTQQIAEMASGAVLVNTARGGVLDLDAAVAALDQGHISGLGLDVYPDEPLPLDSPLLDRPDTILTPHVAFYSEEALVELRRRTAENVVRILGPAR
jgi:D-3-phosphoglycerate dehydrogenase